MKCTGRRTDGQPCTQHAIRGTDRCANHAGRTKAEQKARGAVVLELRRWGLTGQDDLTDPGVTLLKLVTQSAQRADFYAGLLAEAYDAAERLAASEHPPTADQVPGQRPNATDAERAAEDLDRIFTTGGVAALISYKYGAAGKDGNLYAAEEALRGLVRLEAEERDRCAAFATKAVAAGLAERQVRLAEQQGALIAQVLRAALSDLGYDPADPKVARVVSTRLRSIAGG